MPAGDRRGARHSSSNTCHLRGSRRHGTGRPWIVACPEPSIRTEWTSGSSRPSRILSSGSRTALCSVSAGRTGEVDPYLGLLEGGLDVWPRPTGLAAVRGRRRRCPASRTISFSSRSTATPAEWSSARRRIDGASSGPVTATAHRVSASSSGSPRVAPFATCTYGGRGSSGRGRCGRGR